MATIDDMLGPASGRFLTGAVQHVQRTVRQVTVKADGGGRVRVTGTADIVDPRVRAEGLTPHLDSLDASLIAAELTECALAGGLGLDADERRRARVRGMDIWAGPRPERELSGIPVVAELSGGQVRGRVGPLRFRLEFEFDPEHGLAIPHETAAAESGRGVSARGGGGRERAGAIARDGGWVEYRVAWGSGYSLLEAGIPAVAPGRA